jgi:hypothetical protein
MRWKILKHQKKANQYKQQIIGQYPKLFKGLGELEGEYEIKLKELPEPFAALL